MYRPEDKCPHRGAFTESLKRYYIARHNLTRSRITNTSDIIVSEKVEQRALNALSVDDRAHIAFPDVDNFLNPCPHSWYTLIRGGDSIMDTEDIYSIYLADRCLIDARQMFRVIEDPEQIIIRLRHGNVLDWYFDTPARCLSSAAGMCYID